MRNLKYVQLFESFSKPLELIDGYKYEGTAILSPETPIEIIYQIFDKYYEGCDIIQGIEGKTEYRDESEWIIIARHDSQYFELGFEKSENVQDLNVRQYMEINQEEYPNFKFSKQDVKIMIPFSDREDFLNDLGKQSGLKFQSHLVNWICKKLNNLKISEIKPSDCKVYPIRGGNLRISKMPKTILEDKKGKIVGKL